VSDYGHDLEFGIFVTPSTQAANAVVELAVLADRVGIDLVTFQDHPYQPTFLDTWTLLSFVAARTSRVKLSANVLNIPLRPPAVVARAVASLDILSGGRAELGLGAGGFHDAIAAMGGPRLTRGQAVDALEEAIDVIRELWDVERPGGARYDGDHYQLSGSRRGPAPLHQVGIWVVPTSLGCLTLRAARPMAGSPALAISSQVNWPVETTQSTGQPPRRAGIRPRSGGC
jgi:alkanesulfonate monooxygenase SsuD/methylene tetrahydromethanopterin reductase-like flavin-dependent oxidoreductase (luciferase family)